jgi:hypothetical protein
MSAFGRGSGHFCRVRQQPHVGKYLRWSQRFDGRMVIPASGMAPAQKCKNMHAGPKCCFDTGRTVFYYEAMLGSGVHHLSGMQKQIGSWLTCGDHRSTINEGIEVAEQPGDLQ